MGHAWNVAHAPKHFTERTVRRMSRINISFIERFWSRVQTGPNCWEWQHRKDKDGYGLICKTREDNSTRAHVAAYEMAYGKVPEGMCVLHACDNPSCVRPSHLFFGTNADNTADRHRKGRSAKGEKNGMAKVTADMVRSIRAQHASGGASFKHLAALYGVSKYTVVDIVRRRYWKHVPD